MPNQRRSIPDGRRSSPTRSRVASWNGTSSAARVAAAACLAFLSSCAGPDHSDRYNRHFSGDIWWDSLTLQAESPARLVPELTLALATPLLYIWDDDITDHMVDNPSITNGNRRVSNEVTFSLGAIATGVAVTKWLGDDDGLQSFEVLAESYALTQITTEALKLSVGRARPSADEKASFPSGHASFTFMCATYLARTTWDATDSWWRGLGFLAYLPATYVGISRIESDKHFPSDVAAGAFLGVFFTNLVYDAHYGHPETKREGIYTTHKELQQGFAPVIDERGVGLAWYLRF